VLPKSAKTIVLPRLRTKRQRRANHGRPHDQEKKEKEKLTERDSLPKT